MNIFKSISDTIAKITKKHKDLAPVNKTDILNLVDNNLAALKVVTDTYEENRETLSFIQSTLLKGPDASGSYTTLRKLYSDYFAALSNSAKQLESSSLLQSFYIAAQNVYADHQTIRDNFTSLFNDGTDVADITPEQLKLTHATLFGFINLSSLMADWFCFFLGSISDGHPEKLRVPPYRVTFLMDSGKQVADFVNDVILRGKSRGIVTVVQSIRQAGDVAIYTDASSLDTYASIDDYPGIARFMTVFDSFQPILMIRSFFTNFSHKSYQRNLILRDWMLAKMAILRMDANKMDPTSPEYKKQQEILQKYSDRLAALDKDIAKYETI